SVPPGRDLGTVVDRVDPGGRRAAAVTRYTSLTSGSAGLSVLGVQPQRFARVAYWNHSFTTAPLPSLAAALAPPAPPPVTLNGDAVRVTVRVRSLVPARAELAADVVVPTRRGRLAAGGAVPLTGRRAGSPCPPHAPTINLAPGQAAPATAGHLVLPRLQVHRGTGWAAVDAGLTGASRWRRGLADHPPDVISPAAGGLGWSFVTPGRQSPAIVVADRPAVLPA